MTIERFETCCFGGITPKATPIANWALDSWNVFRKLIKRGTPRSGAVQGVVLRTFK